MTTSKTDEYNQARALLREALFAIVTDEESRLVDVGQAIDR